MSFERQLCYLLMFVLSESYLRSDDLIQGQDFAHLASKSVLAFSYYVYVFGTY